MSIEDSRISAVEHENASHDLISDIHEDGRLQTSAGKGVEVAQASNIQPTDQQPAPAAETTGRLPAAPEVTATAPEVTATAPTGQVVPDQNNVAHLPAGTSIDDIHVEGNNLVLVQADGTEIVIVNGALHVPTFLLGEVELPQQAVIAALEQSNINVAAGPDGSYSASASPSSSGADFQDGLQPNANDPTQLASLLADTNQADAAPDGARENINDVPVTFLNAEVQLDDGSLPGGNGVPALLNTTGTLGFAYGADRGGTVLLTGAGLGTTAAGEGSFFQTVSGDGRSVVISQVQHGTVVTVLTVTLSDTRSGQYTVMENNAIQHAAGQGENNQAFTIGYQVTDRNGDFADGTLTLNVKDDTIVWTGSESKSVDEDDLSFGNDFPRESTSVVGKLNISWGADSYDVEGAHDGAGRSLVFASANLAVTSDVPLTSNGIALTYALSEDGTTLNAYAGERPIFTVELNDDGTGTYTFTLQGPLDHSEAGQDSLGISFHTIATDSDGDPAAVDFSVSVTDDVPLAIGQLVTHYVEEEELKGGNEDDLPGGIAPDADGNYPFLGHVNATTNSTSGSLLISWGSDNGNAVANGGVGGLGDRSVVFAGVTAVLDAPQVLTAEQAADIISVKSGSTAIDLSTLKSSGVPLTYTLSGNGTVLTATADGKPVFTVTLTDTGAGGYKFVLDGVLDHPVKASGAALEDVLSFSFNATVRDADGDQVKTSFTIGVIDDSPIVSKNDVVHLDDGAMTGGNGAAVVDHTTGTLAHSYGADGVGALILTGASAGSTVLASTATAEGSFFQTVSEDSGIIVISQIQHGVAVNVLSITLAEDKTSGDYEVKQLAAIQHVAGNGENNQSFTIGYQVTDGDGDTANGTLTINVKDDVIAWTASDSASVNEDDLSGGNDLLKESTTATGKLNISWGADNYDVNNRNDGAGRSLVFSTATSSSAISAVDSLGNAIALTSNGQALTYVLSDNGTKLVASAHGETIFTVTVNDDSTGSYSFKLQGSLDQNVQGEDALKLTFHTVATDSDGDKANVDFAVSVTDDVPLAIGQIITRYVEEEELKGGNEDNSPGVDGDFSFLGHQVDVTTKSAGGALNILWGSDDANAVVNGGVGALGDRSVVFATVTGSMDISATDAAAFISVKSGNQTIALADLTSGGDHLTYTLSANGTVLTAHVGNETIFTVTLSDTGTGGYNFVLSGALDHPVKASGAANEDVLSLTFNATVRDSDGDQIKTSFTIGVIDDSPVISTPASATVSEAGSLDPLANGSFEQDNLATGQNGVQADSRGNYTYTAPSGWTITGGTGGVFAPSSDIIDPAGHNGSNVVWLHSGAVLAKDTGTTLVAGQVYSVHFDVGDRTDQTFGGGIVKLFATNGITTVELSSLALPVPADGKWASVDLNSPLIGSEYAGWQLRVEITQTSGTGNQILIDDVELQHFTAQVAQGSLGVQWGADSTGSVVFNTTQNTTGLVSNGQAIHYEFSPDNTGLKAISADGRLIFTVELSKDTGQYKFTLLDSLDQQGASQTISFNFTATDGDGDTASSQFTVTVNDTVPSLSSTLPVGAISEDGVTSISGQSLGITWGADDNNGGTANRSVAFGNFQAPQGLSSNGNTITYAFNADHTILTATAAGVAVFIVTLTDQATGAYAFQLLQPLDHAAPVNGTQYLDLGFGFTATDSDGDPASGSFTIRVDAAGSIGSIHYDNLTTGVFVNLSGSAQTVGDQTVAAHSAADRTGINGGNVVGHDALGATVDAYGSSGNDILIGGDENNHLVGGAGNDLLVGGKGADTLEGGEGDDTFKLGADLAEAGPYGPRVIDLGNGHLEELSLAGLAGSSDTVIGGAGTDTIVLDREGSAGFVFDSYNADSPTLSGIEKIVGTDGNDIILLKNDYTSDNGGGVTIDGGAGNDAIGGGKGNDYLIGGDGDDLISGLDGDDTILGGAGNDRLYGGAGNDTIDGGDGDDVIEGGGGADKLTGGIGNDRITANTELLVNGGFKGPGERMVSGGSDTTELGGGWTVNSGTVDLLVTPGSLGAKFPAGVNAIDMQGVSAGVIEQSFATVAGQTYTVSFLQATNPDLLGHTNLTTSSVTVIVGGVTQTFVDNAEAGVTWGTVAGTFVERTITFTATGSSTTLQFAAGGDTAYGSLIAEVSVTPSAPGVAGATIDGGEGNDVITGGAGNDILDGGIGDDLIRGGAGNDTITGGAGDDFISGSAGNDVLSGGAGNDTFSYSVGDGSDTVDGGADNDTLHIVGGDTAATFNINAVTIDGANNLGVNIEAGGDTVVAANAQNYEVVTKNVEEWTIDGGAAGDKFVVTGSLSGTGLSTSTLTINGGAGNDVLDVSKLTSNEHVVFHGGAGDQDTIIFAADWKDAAVTQTQTGFQIKIGGQTYDVDGTEKFVFSNGTATIQTLLEAAPTGVTGTLAVAENAAAGTVVGTLAGVDVNGGLDKLTYAFVDAQGHASQTSADGRFVIDANSGLVTVAANAVINFEATPTLTETVRVTDVHNNSKDQSVSIGVTDVNEAPHVQGSLTAVVAEGGQHVLTWAELGANDPDAADTKANLTFTASSLTNGKLLVNGHEASSFTAADVDGGKVVFVHNGSETSSAGFNISLADGGENGVGPDTGHISFMVTPVDDGKATLSIIDRTQQSDAPKVGDLIQAGIATHDPDNGEGTVTYHWLRDSTEISNASGATYTLTTADVGSKISVYATYTDGQGFATTTSTVGLTTAVVSPNHAPVAVDDIVITNVSNISIPDWALLLNDTDQDGNSLQITKAASTSRDSVTHGTDAVSFTDDVWGIAWPFPIPYPNGGSFEYTVTDGIVSKTADVVVQRQSNLTGTEANEILISGSDGDFLDGAGGNDVLLGNGGDDTLKGGAGADRMYGGSGNDSLYGDQSDIVLDGGTGTDTLYVAGGFNSTSDDQIVSIERVVLTAAGTLDLSKQTEGFVITGSSGSDTIMAGSGNDTINYDIGDGADNVDGGAGNNTLAILGGSANETLSVTVSGSKITTVAGGNIVNVEHVTLNMDGGSDDVLTYAATSQDIVVNLSNGTATGFDSIAGVDDVTGGSGNDSLTGNSGANTLIGGAGDDTLTGGGGSDTLTGGVGNDTFNIDSGTDTVTDLSGGDILKVSSNAAANATATGDWTAAISTVNNGSATVFANGNDINLALATGNSGWTLTNSGNSTGVTLTGSAKADVIIGGSGNDIVNYVVGSGADSVNGGNGTDKLVVAGTAGNDTLSVIVSGDKITQLAGGSITNIEQVTADLGAGTGDTLSYTGSNQAVTIDLSAGTATGFTSIAGIENFVGGLSSGDTLKVTGGFVSTGDSQLSSIENVTLTSTGAVNLSNQTESININGTSGADTITASTGGGDINAGAGADRVVIDAGNVTSKSWSVDLGSDAVSDTLVFKHDAINSNNNTVVTVDNFGSTDKIAVLLNGTNVADGGYLTIMSSGATVSSAVEVIELQSSSLTNSSLSSDASNGTIAGVIASAIGSIKAGDYTVVVYASQSSLADAGIYSVHVTNDAANLAVGGFTLEHIMTLDNVGYGALTAANFTSSAIDPIILDLDHNGIALTTLDNGVSFDINADGHQDKIAWTAGSDGILAYDVDGNGTIDNGSEIFSPHFAGGTYVDGLAALATLDSNHDGKIDANDEAFSKLTIWQDLNHNGISDAGELSSLSDHQIASLSLDAHASDSTINGQSILSDGSYTLDDGSIGHFVEVAFDTTLGGSTDSHAYSLIGSDGDDVLSGAGGMVTMTGGAGADTFVLDTEALADVKLADVITDYKASEGDTLDVSKLLDSLLGHQATEAEALSSVKTTVSGADTVVSVNANGGWHDVAVLQNNTEAVKILFDDKHEAVTAPHVG